MKLDILLHPWRYYTKDSVRDATGIIKNTLIEHPARLDIETLIDKVTSGHTLAPGKFEYTQSDTISIKKRLKKFIPLADRHWVSQQLFMIDIDNDLYTATKKQEDYLSIDKAIQLASNYGAKPAFVYTTYSHTEEVSKFRMGFVLSRTIANHEERRLIYQHLFNALSHDGVSYADVRCSDPSRIFYPGREIVYKDTKAKVDVNRLLKNDLSSLKPLVSHKSITVSADLDNNHTRKEHPLFIKLLMKNTVFEARDYVADLIKGDSSLTGTKDRGVSVIQWAIINNNKLKPYRPVNDLTDSSPTLPMDPAFQNELARQLNDYCPLNDKAPARPVVVRHSADFYELARRLPLHLLFGKQIKESMPCMLPGHNDSHDSAQFEVSYKSGIVQYRCYKCMQNHSESYDIFQLIEALTGWAHVKTRNKLADLLGLTIESEWQAQKRKDIMEYFNYVRGHLHDDFPYLYKELVRSNKLGIFEFMLTEAQRLLYDKEVTGTSYPVFFKSEMHISKQLTDRLHRTADKKYTGTSRQSVHNKLKDLAKLGLIQIVPNEDLSPVFLKESRLVQLRKGHSYRISYYSVPEFRLNLFHEAEKRLKDEKVKGERKQFRGRQMELMANGREGADKIYVQDNYDLPSATLEFYVRYKEVALNLIAEKGFFTEKELLNHRRLRGNKKKKKLGSICLPRLLKEHDLYFVKYTKKYKEIHGISQEGIKPGASKIVVPADLYLK